MQAHRRRSGRRWRSITVAATLATLAAACAGGAPEPLTATDPGRGAALYGRHCAGCHGRTGDADTSLAGLLFPPPTAFRNAAFKLASTQNGVPTDADLVRTLRRGMPGSAMPGYEWLPDDDLRALARRVHELAVAGMTESLAAAAAARGSSRPWTELREEAESRLRPGAPVAVPEPVAASPAVLAQGRSSYLHHCATCHGEDGRGRRQPGSMAGTEARLPRDFTAGFLRGSASAQELAWRIRGGMPGAHMPTKTLSDDELANLIAYLHSLIPDAADRHHVQWRRHLHAPFVSRLPTQPDDPGWETIEAVRLPLAPLRWRPDAVFEAWVRAAHDGVRVAFQLHWRDPSRDDRIGGAARQGDGAALQFTGVTDPPLLAMGGREPVNIWHWRAFRQSETAGVLDLLQDPLHQGLDVAPHLPGVTGPAQRAESVEVTGPGGMAGQRGTGLAVAAAPRWHDDHWTLVLVRDLPPRVGHEIALLPGRPVLLGLAVWNGSVDSIPGTKSVTTWHVLELQQP